GMCLVCAVSAALSASLNCIGLKKRRHQFRLPVSPSLEVDVAQVKGHGRTADIEARGNLRGSVAFTQGDGDPCLGRSQIEPGTQCSGIQFCGTGLVRLANALDLPQ